MCVCVWGGGGGGGGGVRGAHTQVLLGRCSYFANKKTEATTAVCLYVTFLVNRGIEKNANAFKRLSNAFFYLSHI